MYSAELTLKVDLSNSRLTEKFHAPIPPRKISRFFSRYQRWYHVHGPAHVASTLADVMIRRAYKDLCHKVPVSCSGQSGGQFVVMEANI